MVVWHNGVGSGDAVMISGSGLCRARVWVESLEVEVCRGSGFTSSHDVTMLLCGHVTVIFTRIPLFLVRLMRRYTRTVHQTQFQGFGEASTHDCVVASPEPPNNDTT